jgi:hypothetical protein
LRIITLQLSRTAKTVGNQPSERVEREHARWRGKGL